MVSIPYGPHALILKIVIINYFTVVTRWASCVIFQILPELSSGAFQDGGKDVNYFVASIPASFGQNFHFSTHKMAENQQKTFKRLPNKVIVWPNMEKRSRGENDNFFNAKVWYGGRVIYSVSVPHCDVARCFALQPSYKFS